MLMSAICYMKVADNFFDRKMDGGVLWQKIKKEIDVTVIEVTEEYLKEKLLEGFRNEEEFGYMAGYEPWEKLIFDR